MQMPALLQAEIEKMLEGRGHERLAQDVRCQQ